MAGGWAAAACSKPRSGVSTTAHTVLVVDDDPIIVEVVSIALALQGCEVTTASSLGSARTAMSMSAVESVVCDWNLDGENSESFLRELSVAFPAVTKILMTGAPATEWRSLIDGGVVCRVLTKPFNLRELVNVVMRGDVADG
ncbi:MAG: Response regulator receiver domain [bacterium]|nr:Response regulator receiver domain [bacterium]